MPQYRKKPIVVEAEQFHIEKKPWPTGVLRLKEVMVNPVTGTTFPRGCICIYTLEGWCVVSDGDWIITGVRGERYPCKPDIFEETYEHDPVET